MKTLIKFFFFFFFLGGIDSFIKYAKTKSAFFVVLTQVSG